MARGSRGRIAALRCRPTRLVCTLLCRLHPPRHSSATFPMQNSATSPSARASPRASALSGPARLSVAPISCALWRGYAQLEGQVRGPESLPTAASSPDGSRHPFPPARRARRPDSTPRLTVARDVRPGSSDRRGPPAKSSSVLDSRHSPLASDSTLSPGLPACSRSCHEPARLVVQQPGRSLIAPMKLWREPSRRATGGHDAPSAPGSPRRRYPGRVRRSLPPAAAWAST